VVYPQIYSTDLNDLICKIDLNRLRVWPRHL
jgi:hypothetical protein